MKAAVLAALILVVVPSAAVARNRTEPPGLQNMRVARTDLKAALFYETEALAAAKKRDSAKAHELLVNARGALNDMAEPVKLLEPDPELAYLYLKATGQPVPWLEFGENWRRLLGRDRVAQHVIGESLIEELENANKLKKEMIEMLSSAIHNQCVELLNLQGPITVNGVPVGHSELTVTLTCDDPIEQMLLDIPNVTWSKVDAGTATIAQGGKLLEVPGNDKKTVSVTAETSPDAKSGDVLEGEVVPIAGDSAPPLDETM